MPGISIAPDDAAMVGTPTWVRIDTTYNVQAWTIDRGRPDEMSQTGTGTATIELVDQTGDFDPTNPTGDYYQLGPLVQAKIEIQNPLTTVWTTLFRGFISAIRWVPYRREDHANVTLELVDGLAFLAACEMTPGVISTGVPYFGHEIFEGNIVFHEDLSLDAIQTRINLALDQAHWPAALRSIFTGNVQLQETPYAPRTPVLAVIQEAAEAEFPNIANVYIGGPRAPGYVVFHGRMARFDPANTEYQINRWDCGDDEAAAVTPATVCRISPPLTASLDDTLLYTSAYATPADPVGAIGDTDYAGQYLTNDIAADIKGLRTWSAESLATRGGVGPPPTFAPTTGLQETAKFAAYVRDNYASARVRVGQLTIKSRDPSGINGAATWNLLCKIDISDIVHLVTTHAGGGGFDTDFYVEGIHYQARPGGTNPYVELTLDVSPRGYYDSNPFD